MKFILRLQELKKQKLVRAWLILQEGGDIVTEQGLMYGHLVPSQTEKLIAAVKEISIEYKPPVDSEFGDPTPESHVAKQEALFEEEK